MSDSAAGNSEFTELWRSVSKLCDGKIQNTTKEQQMSDTTTSPVIKGDAVNDKKKITIRLNRETWVDLSVKPSLHT